MKTAENLCLDFGCLGEKEFCKGLSLFSFNTQPPEGGWKCLKNISSR